MRIFLSILLTAAVSLQAGEIRGRVLDPSGSAVPGARVSVVRQTNTSPDVAVSAADGSYGAGTLAAGEYLVEAQAPGFGASPVQRVVVTEDGIATLDLTLQLQRVSTQVQVTSASGAQTVDEQAKALSVIDAVELGNRAEFSVAEAIRTSPGIRVQQLGGPGSFVRVLSRGMRPVDTAVLIDGFRLRDAASPQGEASAFIGDLLLGGTDRIEVLRGSGASLYGTHATGGVINIITATGTSGFHGEVGAEGGGLGLIQGIAKVSGAGLDQRLRYALGATHLNVTKGIDGNDATRNSVLHGMAQYRLGSATDLTGRLLANDSFAQLNDTPYLDASGTLVPSPDDPDNRRAGGYLTGLVALSHHWSPRASTRLSYQGLTTERDNRDGPAGTRFEPVGYLTSDRFNGRLDTVQARTDFEVAKQWITVGYEWEREHFFNRSLNEFAAPSLAYDATLLINQNSHALFAQDQIHLLDRRLQLSVSGRVQHFNLSQPEFSDETSVYRNTTVSTPPRAMTGDASAAYFIQSTGTKARAHIGNGYRSPSLYERFGGSYFGGFSVFGDPRLRPEQVLAFDFGFDQYLGQRARVSATYFYTRLQEGIAFDFSGAVNPDTDPFGRFGGYRNTGGGIARGVELSLEANPTRSLTLRSAYTYTNADERRSIFASGNLRAIRVSDHMFTGTATQRFGRAFDVTFDLFAASDYLLNFGSSEYWFNGPIKADIALNYTKSLTESTSLRLFTRVDNMFNQTYYEDGFRTPKAWAVVGMRLLF